MNIGWCDICITVESTGKSREFYEKLGFRCVEGDDSEGWAVITNGDVRLGLFEAKFMDGETFTLNFRSGDVFAIADSLKNSGIEMTSGPKRGSSGGCSATLKDPDGHVLFFDTAPGETKQE
jgi:lactoylglutathione lyase